LVRSSSSAWQLARPQPDLTSAPCCRNVGDSEPEEEEEGEHLHPGELGELLGGLGVLGQGAQGELGEQRGPVGEQGGLEEEQALLGKSAAAVGDHYTGAVGGPVVAVQPRCSGIGAQGFRCIDSEGLLLTRYTGRWGRTAGLVPGGELGAPSWCDGDQGGHQQGSGVPGGPEWVVVVAVVAAVAVGAGTCWGLSDVVEEGDRLLVLRTFALRGGACRTGRSLSFAGIARTSPPPPTCAGRHTLHRCRLS